MLQLHDGQCGLCNHFGQHHTDEPTLVDLKASPSIPETSVDDCTHPKHAPLHLKVTPASGCDGFEPMSAN